MRYLQWAPFDIETGIGGVEVHGRSLHREFLARGIDSHISSNPALLKQTNPGWDVIHTHGSAPLPIGLEYQLRMNTPTRPLRVVTLHGNSFDRMKACGEWASLSGWRSWGRELLAIAEADVVASVHENNFLNGLVEKMGKGLVICGNGYDAGQGAAEERLPDLLERRLKDFEKFWLYVGRGNDPVKNTQSLARALQLSSSLKLVAVPGDGFRTSDQILLSGKLTSTQVRTLMKRSQGLILCSRFEALPLVVLEALSLGVGVVATPVGGIPSLASKNLKGLLLTHGTKPEDIAESLLRAMPFFAQQSTSARSQHNCTLLSTWSDVAGCVLGAVKKVRP